MKPVLTAAAIALAAGLAACSQQQTEPAEAPAAPAAAEPAAPAEAARTATGSGTVTAVDPAAGTITIDHAAIPEANWPAMTMAFKAPAEAVSQAKVGDKVAFDLKLEGSGGEITAIRPQ